MDDMPRTGGADFYVAVVDLSTLLAYRRRRGPPLNTTAPERAGAPDEACGLEERAPGCA